MRRFLEFGSADRFCRAYDKICNFLRPAAYPGEKMSLDRRWAIHVRRVAALRDLISAA
jgi:hypothetical protein